MGRRVLLFASFAFLAVSPAAQDVTITVLHTNDMHARVEGFKIKGKDVGGYARLATLIRKFQRQDPNPILLNAGDTFQGTLYFNVYEGLADLAFMNYAGFKAMAVGNHEFDRGPKVLGAFARGAQFPILAANLDVTNEPELSQWVGQGAIVTAGRVRVGIVGAVTPDLFEISSPGPNLKLRPLVPSVQSAIDALRQRGIDKIVVLTHVGYHDEIALAKRLRGVDVLVGGHSHTYLGPEVPDLVAAGGPYPTVVKNADGDTALVVQAWDWGKVLGRIKVTFDRDGKVKSWSDAKPIPVDASVEEDPTMKSIVAALRRPIADLSSKVLGEAALAIPRSGSGESPMGNLICDAMLEATAQQGAVAAFMNSGGIRAALEQGPITYGAAIAVQPFGNTLVLLDLTGAELLEALEHGAEVGGGFLHVSAGTSYVVDLSKPRGQRVTGVVVGGKPLDTSATYRLCFSDFTASGGDGHSVLKKSKGRRADTGLLDLDALIDYLKRHSPVAPKLEGRIRLVGASSLEALWIPPMHGVEFLATLASFNGAASWGRNRTVTFAPEGLGLVANHGVWGTRGSSPEPRQPTKEQRGQFRSIAAGALTRRA